MKSPTDQLARLDKLEKDMNASSAKLLGLGDALFTGNSDNAGRLQVTQTAYGLLRSNIGTLRRGISKGLASGHDWKMGIDGFQGTKDGYGGAAGEMGHFDEAVEAAHESLVPINATLGILQNTDLELLEQLGYLKDPRIKKLVTQLGDLPAGSTLTAEDMLRTHRAKTLTGNDSDMDTVTETNAAIKALAGLTPDTLRADITRLESRFAHINKADEALTPIRDGIVGTLGIDIDAEAMLYAHGDKVGAEGGREWGASSAVRMFSDETFQDRLIAGLYMPKSDDPEFDASEIMRQRAAVLERQLPPGISDAVMRRIRGELALMTVQRDAGVQRDQTPIELLGYDLTRGKAIVKHDASASARSLGDTAKWDKTRQDLQDSVSLRGGPGSASPLALAEALDDVGTVVAAGRGAEGPWSDEAAGPGNVSLRDSHEVFKKIAPGYERATSGRGSVLDQPKTTATALYVDDAGGRGRWRSQCPPSRMVRGA